MNVRDAVEADAEGLAAIADGPADVMRNLVHDRSVRVAVEEASGEDDADRDDDQDATAQDDTDQDASAQDAAADPDVDADGGEASILGFVSFDARPDAVHVTQLAGTQAAVTRLLEEPLAFARREGMPVELLVPADGEAIRGAVEDAGFDERGAGPQFEGDPTVRYRFDS